MAILQLQGFLFTLIRMLPTLCIDNSHHEDKNCSNLSAKINIFFIVLSLLVTTKSLSECQEGNNLLQNVLKVRVLLCLVGNSGMSSAEVCRIATVTFVRSSTVESLCYGPLCMQLL